MCNVKGLASSLTYPLLNFANRFHRLAYCLTATYGRTLCTAAEEQLTFYPHTIALAAEDSTAFILSSLAAAVAFFVSIVVGLLGNADKGSWPLFFFVVFYLSYAGISLCLHVYVGAVDALIVAYAVKPERFARENQIVFLRFLRHSETGLR